MIRYNGQGYSDWSALPFQEFFFSQLGAQFTVPIYWQDTVPIFWEATYFHWMSSLRRWRMQIPMTLTPDYLESQLKAFPQTAAAEQTQLFELTAFRQTPSHAEAPLSSLGWILEYKGAFPTASPSEPVQIELYKEVYLSEDYYATLPASQQTQRDLAQTYAHENGYADCLLLNSQKNIVESAQGSLFLLSDEGEVITPDLASGCQATVLRAAFIDWLKKQEGIAIQERPVSPFELQKADALSLLSPFLGVFSVSSYRKKTYTETQLQQWFDSFWAVRA